MVEGQQGMQQMVPVFMSGPQGGQLVQLPMHCNNGSGFQQPSGMCYTFVPVSTDQHQSPFPDLQQQHLQPDLQMQSSGETSPQHHPLSPQHQCVTQVVLSPQHGQNDHGENGVPPHLYMQQMPQQEQRQMQDQLRQLQQLMLSEPRLRDQYEQPDPQGVLGHQVFGQRGQPQTQIPPPPRAPPPDWVEHPDRKQLGSNVFAGRDQGIPVPHGMPVYGQGQQRQVPVPPPEFPTHAWEAGIRQRGERMWAHEDETMHGWRYAGTLPERGWAEMSEQGQPHSPMLREQLPIRGQLLGNSLMGSRSATEGSMVKDPAFRMCPGSTHVRLPRPTTTNIMPGGPRAGRQLGRVDCFFSQESLISDVNGQGLLTNMKTQLQALLAEDPATVFIARRINKLGFSSAEYLRTHFRIYGEVKNIYVSHSRVKVNLPRNFRGERRSSDTRQRLRPASLAFVVMTSTDSTARILADGPEHVVNGVTVLLQSFQRRERAEGGTDECNEAADLSAVDEVDYPRWPSPFSETEGDNVQSPQALLDSPPATAAEISVFDETAQHLYNNFAVTGGPLAH